MADAVHVIIMLVLACFATTVIGPIVTWLVRFVIRFVAAAGATLVMAAIAVGVGLEDWVTVLLALVSFVLTFTIFDRRGGLKPAPPASPVLRPVRWMRQHRVIAKAWCDIADYWPEMASELRRAEQACAALLRAADGEPKSPGFDLDLIELTALIKRHVPELVVGLPKVGATGRSHARGTAEEVAGTLVLLGIQAQAILNRAGWSGVEEFRLRLDHLNRRLRAFDGAHRPTESMGIR
ncbi:MAG: hypothetical protein P1U62_08925 [Alteraurantiacibacter sp. bin_em_oilr2.035]|nr:hypothetical protein [Alteraurantiacibacter sp. bin_em_oilr2.035]